MRSTARRLASACTAVVERIIVSDIKRLENELRILWEAIQQDVQEEHPKMARPERRQLARSRFVQIVDDKVREVARD